MPRVLVLHDGSGPYTKWLNHIAEYGSVHIVSLRDVAQVTPESYTHVYLDNLPTLPSGLGSIPDYSDVFMLLSQLAKEEALVQAFLDSGLTLDALRIAIVERMNNDGLSKREISARLGCHPRTASRIRSNLRNKQNAVHTER